MNTNLITTHDPEYDKAFWNAMRGRSVSVEALNGGKTSMGTIKFPSYTAGKFTESLAKESLFRKIGTVLYNQGDHKFWARDCDDTASFVPEGSAIPIYDGMDDFTVYDINSYKLAAVVRLDEDFVFSPGYNLEKHMTAHLAKAFSRAEEKTLSQVTVLQNLLVFLLIMAELKSVLLRQHLHTMMLWLFTSL